MSIGVTSVAYEWPAEVKYYVCLQGFYKGQNKLGGD